MDVQTEDLNKAISEVVERFDGADKISVEQREGIENSIQRMDVLAVLPTGNGKSLLFQLLPGICLALNKMGYTSYPKSAIILVICPLNALIESHMKELRQRGISFRWPTVQLVKWWYSTSLEPRHWVIFTHFDQHMRKDMIFLLQIPESCCTA